MSATSDLYKDNEQQPRGPHGKTGPSRGKKHSDRAVESNENVAELKKSEERYHKMIEEVEDYAILLLDRKGIIQNWNRGAEKIKGYKEREIVGKSFRVFYLPEDREKKLPEALINEAVRMGKAVHEGWRLRKDGTRFWGSIVITALHDEHNEILGFSKVTRDLTDIKVATDKIKNYTRELELQNKELQQFTYAAAHDMKEPLRKVQFYNSAILQILGENIPEKAGIYLNNSINAVERMTGLIDDLLRYSETAVITDKFEWVDLRNLLDEARAMIFQDAVGTASIHTEAEEPLEIRGIPFQLRQLFENLVGNAIKYKQQNQPVHIEISCTRSGGPVIRERGPDTAEAYYKIAIKDNGIGFDPKYAEQIFELFQRLHSRADYPGTGVGLAICKKIVQNHKGYIEAHSVPGEGSVFTVYLPCYGIRS